MITSTKRYVLVVNFSIIDSITFLDKMKQWFNRDVPWNKYRPEITTQHKNNNLD